MSAIPLEPGAFISYLTSVIVGSRLDWVKSVHKERCPCPGQAWMFALACAVSLCTPCLAQTDNTFRESQTQISSGSSPIAVIPFELVRDHIFVEVTIDHSRPLSMLIDSAAAFSDVNDQIANELKLASNQTAAYEGIGKDERAQAGITKNHDLHLGDLVLKDMAFWILPTADFSRYTGRAVDGALGADLFERYVVEIDYAARRLRLYSPDGYILPRATYVLPLTFVPGWMVPLLQSKVTARDGTVANVSLDFDTGSGPNYLSKSFSDAYPSMVSSGKTIPGPKGAGTNGSTTYLAGRVKEIQLGNLRISEPVVLFSLDSSGLAAQSDYSGSIGGEILEGFTIVVDYKRQRIAFEPNGQFGLRAEYDMSGIHLLSDKSDFHRFEVDFVAADSVASQKGILVGDMVVSVNGKVPSTLTLDEIDQLLVQPGKIKLKLMRSGKQYKATLKLSPRI
jgi:hypothetical protein